jgi:hypothetical protein
VKALRTHTGGVAGTSTWRVGRTTAYVDDSCPPPLLDPAAGIRLKGHQV